MDTVKFVDCAVNLRGLVRAIAVPTWERAPSPVQRARRASRHRGRRRRGVRTLRAGCVILSVLAAFSSLISSVSAQDSRPTESQVKAAYLFNFGKFVRWTTERSPNPESFEICVFGKDPFGPILDSTVAGESIDGKKIAIRRVASLQEASPCSVLYVSVSEESRLAPILNAAQNMSVLTVSDIHDFAARGGAIGLVRVQGKIRFEVNRLAAQQSHLELSSELLKVAMKVIEKPVPGT